MKRFSCSAPAQNNLLVIYFSCTFTKKPKAQSIFLSFLRDANHALPWSRGFFFLIFLGEREREPRSGVNQSRLVVAASRLALSFAEKKLKKKKPLDQGNYASLFAMKLEKQKLNHTHRLMIFRTIYSITGCLHDTGATFAPE